MSEEQKTEAKLGEVVTRFSLETMEGVRQLSEHIINEMAQGRMSTKTADPINTAMRVHWNYLRLNQKYLEMMIHVYAAPIKAGTMSLEQLLDKIPLVRRAAEEKKKSDEDSLGKKIDE